MCYVLLPSEQHMRQKKTGQLRRTDRLQAKDGIRTRDIHLGKVELYP